MELMVFSALAFLMAICSVLVITLRNPVKAIAALVIDMFLLAGVYALLGADFVAAIQIIVYTGAVLTLFMFVIMLLNLKEDALQGPSRKFTEYLGILTFFVFSCCLGIRVVVAISGFQPFLPIRGDNTLDIALRLFVKYLWPFELASILILLAVVASLVIAQRLKNSGQLG